MGWLPVRPQRCSPIGKQFQGKQVVVGWLVIGVTFESLN